MYLPVVPSAAAVWTVRGSGLDDPRPRCKSDVFHSTHRTVHCHKTEPFAIFCVQLSRLHTFTHARYDETTSFGTSERDISLFRVCEAIIIVKKVASPDPVE